MDVEGIKRKIEKFASERDWNQFHSPKNLIMALSSEVGELSDIFQWLTEEQSKKDQISDNNLELAKEEIADILIYLIRISDKLDIDLEKEVFKKIESNEKKYPIDKSKGNAVKYNRRDG